MKVATRRYFKVEVTKEEQRIIDDCYNVIEHIVNQMREVNCNEVASDVGLIVTIDDCIQVMNILDDLSFAQMMYNTNEGVDI